MHKVQELTRSVAPSTDYPNGDVRDNTSTIDGTEWNRIAVTDMLQFFQKIAIINGITPNALDDNTTNGYQTVNALLGTINAVLAPVIINSIPNYDSTKFYVLSGLATYAQDGYMFHSGTIYFVQGTGTAPMPTAIIQQRTTMDVPNFECYVTGGTSGSGLVDLSALVYDFMSRADVAPTYHGTYQADGTIPIIIRKVGKTVIITGKLGNSGGATGVTVDEWAFTVPNGYKPSRDLIDNVCDLAISSSKSIPISIDHNNGHLTIKGTSVSTSGGFTSNGLYFNIRYEVDL